MVYVVERYLPGLSRASVLPRLSRLKPVIEELRGQGSVVRYLGSTFVLEDDACFCEFESPLGDRDRRGQPQSRPPVRPDRPSPARSTQPQEQ